MRKIKLTFLSTLVLTIAFGQLKPHGTYVGVEKINGYSSSEKPKYVWYHLSVLTFKGDSIFLEQSPVAIYKKDTIFSASDGGFYSYSGIIFEYDGQTMADLKLKSCDYCPKQFTKFTPPRIVKDEDTTEVTSDSIVSEKPTIIEYPNSDYKIMVLEKTRSSDIIMVNKNIYKRQKQK